MLKAQIDKKGYTPGQVIQLSTVSHNKSEKTTSNINASLVQVNRPVITPNIHRLVKFVSTCHENIWMTIHSLHKCFHSCLSII